MTCLGAHAVVAELRARSRPPLGARAASSSRSRTRSWAILRAASRRKRCLDRSNFKANLAEVDVLGQSCGDSEAISYNGGIRCFLDDPTYRGDANVPGSWRADCAALGGLASGAPGATKLKNNPGQSVVAGLCQTFVLGSRLAGPGPDFARTGQRTPIIP